MAQHYQALDPAPGQALGQSDAFLAFQERLSAVAAVERPVILIGERGAGKELAAMRLHYLSTRWDKPLVTLNCAALPESLLESELFGHEPGAFTGALKVRHGRFEAARHGTLFLDEAASIPLSVQEKILRVVEYGVFERLGASEPKRVDVRLIAAANADLAAMARQDFKAQAIQEIGLEGALPGHGGQIGVGGGDEPHIHALGVGGTQALEDAVFDHAQYFFLDGQRDGPGLVEKQGAVAGGLETAVADLERAGKRPGLMPEELGFEQRPGKSGAIEGDKGPVPAF